jgi:hypothetical protein
MNNCVKKGRSGTRANREHVLCKELSREYSQANPERVRECSKKVVEKTNR